MIFTSSLFSGIKYFSIMFFLNSLTETINADGLTIRVYTKDFENDFISLSDIAKKREGEYPRYVIQNWMRSKSTVSFLGLWETIHNPGFNYLEFEAIKSEAGDNGFVMTPKRWIESTNVMQIKPQGDTIGELEFRSEVFILIVIRLAQTFAA